MPKLKHMPTTGLKLCKHEFYPGGDFDSKPVFKLEYQVLNSKKWNSLDDENKKYVVEMIETFEKSLSIFKSEIKHGIKIPKNKPKNK